MIRTVLITIALLLLSYSGSNTASDGAVTPATADEVLVLLVSSAVRDGDVLAEAAGEGVAVIR